MDRLMDERARLRSPDSQAGLLAQSLSQEMEIGCRNSGALESTQPSGRVISQSLVTGGYQSPDAALLVCGNNTCTSTTPSCLSRSSARFYVSKRVMESLPYAG